MARKPRIQFEGALYHVLNRGNYGRDVFESAAPAQAFEQCLFEACGQAGWRLHAYAIMRNHYHLAVETPRANLVEGMHWLQSTFAARFNRLRKERGHLFQSRYQAILIEPGLHLARVVNYIHLKPVRAGIVPLAQLAQFRWSSYRRFVKGARPNFLTCAEWLRELGGLADEPEGWSSYQDYLGWLAVDEAEQKRQAFEDLASGWAIGGASWRQAIAREQASLLASHALHGSEVAELKEAAWTAALDALLADARRSRKMAEEADKGADWKVEIAAKLRATTTATNPWIARELCMGAASSLSVYLCRRRQIIKN